MVMGPLICQLINALGPCFGGFFSCMWNRLVTLEQFELVSFYAFIKWGKYLSPQVRILHHYFHNSFVGVTMVSCMEYTQCVLAMSIDSQNPDVLSVILVLRSQLQGWWLGYSKEIEDYIKRDPKWAEMI